MSDTESADEVVQTLNPPKKRCKKNHIDVQTKKAIVNIYQQNLKDNPTVALTDIQQMVADKVGVSSRSVFNVIREYETTHTLSSPKTNQNRKKFIDTLDDFDKSAIRKKIHEYFFRNEIPTIDKVLRDVNDDIDLPSFKRTTFYKYLRNLNFKFQKRGKNSFLLDRTGIILWRRDYLNKIRQYRTENRKIYYLDETWINTGHRKSKARVDVSVTSSRCEFLNGLSTGKGKPEGKPLIICYIGNENGFVPDTQWVFESNKRGDYHEIDGKSFEGWFEKILPKLEDNAVIVMDNASCHSRKLEKIPTTTSKKLDVQDWLHSKDIPFEESLLKIQLLEIVKEHKIKYNKYIVDELAKKHDKIILRLPPYHCELNPTELVWAHIKNYVVANNTTFKFDDFENLFHTELSTVSKEKWKNSIDYVQEIVEPKMWELDNLIQTQIINLNNDSSSSESE